MSVNMKYRLYERSVQTPETNIEIFEKIHKEINRKLPHDLREDFSGTFLISSHWVRRHSKNTARALDLDPEPLAYGKKHHYAPLSASEKRRLTISKQNVLSKTPKADLQIACNFSFLVFKDRKTMMKYFKFARSSLRKNGLLILEAPGGPGMIEETKEIKRLSENRKPLVTYYWDQQVFNPIDRNGHYGIHFRLPDGALYENVFTYDWRIWTIPELREAMTDAGFSQTHVYWEKEGPNGEETGIYERSEFGDNAHAWIAYVVGQN